MGPKRKPKQKQKQQKYQPTKRVKMIDTKSTLSKNNQSLIHQYFPNICITRQRAYQNILKKPNGIMKQQKKLSKQLLTQQTLIIKQINFLFHNVFRQADHQMINEMWNILMMRNNFRYGVQHVKEKGYNSGVNIYNEQKVSIVGRQQNIGNNQQSFYSSQSTVTVQCLNQRTKEQQLHPFLVDLEQYRYDFTPFAGSKSQKVIKSKDMNCQPSFTMNSSSQPLCFSNQNNQQQQQFKSIKDQPIQQKDQTIIKLDFQEKTIQSKHQQQQKQNQNLFVINIQTQNNKQLILNIQFNQNSYLQQTNQNQQQQNINIRQKISLLTQKLSLLTQKLRIGIDNIFNFIQKNQHKKQQAIKFKKYVTQLKKQQHLKKQIKFFSISNQNSLQQKQQTVDDVNNLSRQSQSKLLLQQQIDNDQIAFDQMNYCFVSNQQYEKQSNNNNNLDILDCILSRKYNENSLIDHQIDDNNDDCFQTQKQTQIYNQNQHLQRIKQIKNVTLLMEQTSTNQKSTNNDIQTGVDSSFLSKENNQNKNINDQKSRLQPSFQLPKQFLTGYSKKDMNPTFFKRIHQCQLQKNKFIQTIQSSLI